MSTYSEKYMRAFVEVIVDEADKKGLTKRGFAKLVWPELSERASREKWQKMRMYDSKSRPNQGVLISDAVDFAKALGMPLSLLTLKAEHKVSEMKDE